jgi:hypothetical protein
MGRWRSRSLFVEYEDPDYPPFFTLEETDDPRGYISLKAKYLEYSDPTEYVFARKVFGSWEPWQKICSSELLSDHIALWRLELKKKLESESLARVRTISEDPNAPQQLAANRLLLQHLSKPRRESKLALQIDLPKPPQKTLKIVNTPHTEEDWQRVFQPKVTYIDATSTSPATAS